MILGIAIAGFVLESNSTMNIRWRSKITTMLPSRGLGHVSLRLSLYLQRDKICRCVRE